MKTEVVLDNIYRFYFPLEAVFFISTELTLTCFFRDVIDLREDDDDEVSVIRISHSPISEAGDCFINFRRQQRGKKPGLKRR